MRLALPFRLVGPELLFGVFHTLVWLLLVLQLAATVVAPLAEVLTATGASPALVDARLE
jgi:hypothetical protein